MLFLPLLLLLGSATTLAAPAPQGPEHGISKMYLVICKDINLEPASKCITVYYLSLIPNDECHTLDASYDNTLSSFEINRMCCAFYDSPKCSNKIWSAKSQKEGWVGLSRSDKVSSYRCNADCQGL